MAMSPLIWVTVDSLLLSKTYIMPGVCVQGGGKVCLRIGRHMVEPAVRRESVSRDAPRKRRRR